MMRESENHREISLGDFFNLILKHWLIIVLVTVLCGVFGYVIAENNKTTEYVSTSTFIIRAESKGVSTSGNNSTTTSNPQTDTSHTVTLMPVFVSLMTTDDCLATVADRLNVDYAGSYDDHTGASVARLVNITFNESDLTISVTVSSPIDKAHAVDVCNYMTEYGISSIKDFFGDTTTSATNTGIVTITTASVKYPTEAKVTAVTTPVFTYAIVGALGGLLLAIIAVVIINSVDTKVRSEDELAKKTSLPVLSVIPQDAIKRVGKKSNKRGGK